MSISGIIAPSAMKKRELKGIDAGRRSVAIKAWVSESTSELVLLISKKYPNRSYSLTSRSDSLFSRRGWLIGSFLFATWYSPVCRGSERRASPSFRGTEKGNYSPVFPHKYRCLLTGRWETRGYPQIIFFAGTIPPHPSQTSLFRRCYAILFWGDPALMSKELPQKK